VWFPLSEVLLQSFSSKRVISKLQGICRSYTSLVAVGGGLVLACSSEGTPNHPTGSAGNGTTASAGTASGGSATAGSATGGNSSAGAGQAGASIGGGGATATGGTGGASGGGGGGAMSGGNAGAGGGGGVTNEPFALKSSAFKEGEEIPLMYKCAEVPPAGQNISPPLSWGPGPTGTKSYAIVMMHLPTPEHWVIWDIPAGVTSLAANVEHQAMPAVPAGSKQSLADLDGFKGSGYLGPCPQAVNSRQSYRFTLYALDVETVPGLSATSSPTQAATAVKAHLVAGSQGVSLTGTQIRTP
jgi:Raf kinase inhibitor-like YbhB/YbcL family protein